MQRTSYAPGPSPNADHGPPLTFMGSQLVSDSSLRYAVAIEGEWRLVEQPNGLNYQLVQTNFVEWLYTATIESSFIVGTQPAPVQLVGPTLTDSAVEPPYFPNGPDNTITVQWTDWYWTQVTVSDGVKVSIAGPSATVFGNTALYTVTLDSPSSSTVTVSYATWDGTAKAEEAEYTARSGTITFDPGQTSQTVAVPVLPSNLSSHNQSFQVALSNPSGAIIANGAASATIDALFTQAGDKNVDLNSASSTQAIANGADPTKGLGGSDSVTLSNAGQDFTTGSKIGDTYSVKGGGGNYNITLGAGTESVLIDGSGTSALFAGVGSFVLTGILSISGGGTLQVNGNLSGGSASVGANSKFELQGSDSGAINFASVGGTLQIDGTTMPTGVISGFDSDDTIDLKGVTFDAYSATVLQTSNNSVELNNVLHVFANGHDYKLQLDPTQNITGGNFQILPDGAGGTKLTFTMSPITGGQTTPFYSTTISPYSAIVYTTDLDGGGGSGFIIGPHSILTAAHVVQNPDGSFDKGIFVNLPDGTSILVNKGDIHPNAQWSNVTLIQGPAAAVQYDWAVINVSADLSKYGQFQIAPNYSGGTVNLTGYPSIVQNSELITVAAVAVPSGTAVFQEQALGHISGESGSPLWIYNGLAAQAVGIASGPGSFDVRFTSTDLSAIQSFMSLPAINAGKVIHGYISGGTVFLDDNINGQLDPSEASTTTDATGGFTVPNSVSPLVAFGGTDTSTGLTFKGQLSAPSGSSVITPLTTLMALLSSDALAEQKVLTSFGLSSSIDLNTFDPITAAKAGSADGAATTAAVAKVYDTVSLMASTLVAAGGDFSGGVKEAFAAIAAAIDGVGVSLTNEAQVKALVLAAAQSDGVSLGQGVADSVAAIVVATNTLLDQQAESGVTGDALLNAIAAIERVVQGTASNAIQQADDDPGQLQALVDSFSGQKLDDAVTTALEHLGDSDTTAPSLTPVADKTLEATSAAGATAFFAATATDNIDGAVPIVFKEGSTVVHSNDVFGLGSHTVTASTIDAAGNLASETFKINVVDTTAPTLAPIADQVLEATTAAGAAASFAAMATDAVDGTDPVTFKEGNTVVHSGDVFSFGTHTITATAVDAAGNQTSQNFKFHVGDTTAPTLTAIANQIKEATSSAGAAAFFTITATDLVDGTDPVVFKEGDTVVNSGDTFGLGNHTITASTIDAAGNPASETFTINVKDTTAPTLTPVADQTLQATTAAGAAVFFTTTVSDLVDGTDPVVFTEGNRVVNSGDIFGVGVHTITATAIDTAGNSATDIFEINVMGATSHNHDPVAIDDSKGVAKGKSLSVSASKGVLANDSDTDHDHLSVGSVNGSAANVGHSIKGDYGTLMLNADGSYSYAATAKALPSKVFAQDTFTYTNADGHGGSDTATLTFSVYDPSFTYKAGSNTILWGDNGKNVLDGSGGHDLVYGGNGADVLIGGKGDILAGGKGADQFVFRAEFGANTILDFDVKNDHLQFDNSVFESVKSILDHTTNTPLGAVISDEHGDSVFLLGVNKSQLLAHSSDLLIA